MARYEETAKYYSRQRDGMLRACLRYDYGKGNFRIVRPLGSGAEVHVYGRMPNSNSTGWWLLGSLREVEDSYNLGARVES